MYGFAAVKLGQSGYREGQAYDLSVFKRDHVNSGREPPFGEYWLGDMERLGIDILNCRKFFGDPLSEYCIGFSAEHD